MITITRTFTVSNGTAPYSYMWTLGDLCASVSPSSGTTNGSITATFSFEDETCLDETTINLTAVSADGCSSTFSTSLSNPCENFALTPISQGVGYQFTVNAASPSCSSSSFAWTYDNTLFSSGTVFSTDFTSTITLTPSTAVVNWPNTSTVSVTATDCNGCSRTATLPYNICKPVTLPITADMNCMANNFVSTVFYVPNPTGCPAAVIDWKTIQFQANPEFTFINVPALGPRAFYISGPLSLTPGLYTAFYTVRTTQGIQTQQGQISIIVNSCADDPIVIPDFTVQVECDDIIGDFVLIDIEDRVLTSLTIDWDTFEIISPPTPLSSNITLVVGINGRHYIQYEIPAITGSDTFRWTVCSTGGFCAFATTYTVILECPVEPTAIDDEDCVECGQAIVINVLDNDLSGGSPLLLSSIAIGTSPTLGSLSVPGNGTIIYTAFPTSAGTDYFTYTVMNASGAVSNEATVTVEVLCSGGDGSAIVCNA